MKKAALTVLLALSISFICGLGLHGSMMLIYWAKGELTEAVYICVNEQLEDIPCG